MGLLTLDLHLPEAQSLKDKRSVVKSLLDRMTDRFNISAAEVDMLDNRSQAVIAVAVVANDNRHISRVLETVRSFVEREPRAVLESWDIEVI